jgi:hypothetical protein
VRPVSCRKNRYFEKFGGEGRDSNPRMVLPTATNKPAAALANGDLSVNLELVSFLNRAFRLETFAR